jgi:hypothetical protein
MVTGTEFRQVAGAALGALAEALQYAELRLRQKHALSAAVAGDHRRVNQPLKSSPFPTGRLAPAALAAHDADLPFEVDYIVANVGADL